MSTRQSQREALLMITMQIEGGLGNQMFQYAAGRALALRRGTTLAVDTRLYRKRELRRDHRFDRRAFGLDCFRMPLVEAPMAQIPVEEYRRRLQSGSLGRIRLHMGLHRLSSRIARTMKAHGSSPLLYREREFSFDPGVLDLPDGSYLAGWWQSERYFADAAEVIRHDFVPRRPPSSENCHWLELIGACGCAVSVHVRRSDYLRSASHGTCSPAYYREAARLIKWRNGANPVFFVFSDDPAWTREHLRLGGETHVLDHNDTEREAHEDMRLMTACDHHIIANSTFSWWGAWLDRSLSKVVVAPEPWFRAPDLDAKDILPRGWLTVPSGVRDAKTGRR